MKNFDIDIDFENQISENIDIDIERKFDIVPCLMVARTCLKGPVLAKKAKSLLSGAECNTRVVNLAHVV